MGRRAAGNICHAQGQPGLSGHLLDPAFSDEQGRRVAAQPGLPLGVTDVASCTATHLALPSAWSLLLYTDGLVEGHAGDASGDRYGTQRLLAHLQQEARAGLDERVLDRVLTSVTMANGGPLPDDIAVLCVSRTTGESGRQAE